MKNLTSLLCGLLALFFNVSFGQTYWQQAVKYKMNVEMEKKNVPPQDVVTPIRKYPDDMESCRNDAAKRYREKHSNIITHY